MIAVASGVGKATGAAAKARAWRRLIGMALLLVPHVPLHYLWRALRLRSPWPRSYLRAAGWAAGASVRTTGRVVPRDVLVVANHISCLDILILAGASGVRFVAKSEVERWPFVGWLASLNRTVYVARTERGRVQEQAAALSEVIAEHQPVALFPEGGTGDGRAIGPFRASLLAAMVPPPPGALLQPVVIDYGREAPLIASHGTSIGREAMRLLAMPGRRRVVIRFLDPIDPLTLPDRKALATAARDAMIAALGAAEAKRL
ncbi:MAG TPA: lysophospholipid acyltransferase family protein [Sphingomonas sp.]